MTDPTSDDITYRLVAAGNEHVTGLEMLFLVTEAANEIEQLRAKLEWMPDGPDGIDCRDETIKLQDENVARLRARVDELQSKCRCVDCHEPVGSTAVCESCAGIRVENVRAAKVGVGMVVVPKLPTCRMYEDGRDAVRISQSSRESHMGIAADAWEAMVAAAETPVELDSTAKAEHPCSDCGAPSEPATLCATSRCIELGIMAAAEQRKRDADICRSIHSSSRQRTELALLCARTIEGASDDQ